ncbi:MAG: hypothetical protein ACLRHG_16940 [Coprococcus phoceensis]
MVNRDRKCIYTGKPVIKEPCPKLKTQSHYFEEPRKNLMAEKKKYTDFVLCFPRRKEAYTQEDDRIKNQKHGSLSA